MSALDRQVGEGAYASPYRSFEIQPVEFCQRNKLDWCQANIVKYVCRFRNKNGIEDLNKARHYLDMLEEFEYGCKIPKEAEAPEPYCSEYALWPFRTKDNHETENAAVSSTPSVLR